MATSGSSIVKWPRLGRGPQVVAMLLVVTLLGAMAIQPTRRLLDQRQRISTMASELTEIETTNSKLKARIERLQDPDYIEQQAREQSGLVLPGEVSYRVMAPSEDKLAAKQRQKAKAKIPPPPEPGLVESFLQFLGFI